MTLKCVELEKFQQVDFSIFWLCSNG